MRLSRTDLLPVLTIMAGGVLGASLSFSFLGSRSSMGLSPVRPVLAPVVAPSATAEALRLARQNAEWRIAAERANERARRRRLEVGRRRLSQDRPELSFANDVDEVQARAEALVREQHVIEEGMKRLAEARGGAGSEAGQRLFDIKEALVEEISDLEQEIVRLRAETRTSHRVASDLLAEARRTIDDDKLRERLRYSRGLIGVQDIAYTREFEAETTRIIEELHEELGRASDAIRQNQLVRTSRF